MRETKERSAFLPLLLIVAVLMVIGVGLFVSFAPVATCAVCDGVGKWGFEVNWGTLPERYCSVCLGNGKVPILTRWTAKGGSALTAEELMNH